MVVFTCNHCGESLQKPKVEKHYQFVCRSVKSLTCVDCFKDFKAEEYVVHTKCVTEDERYSAKGTFKNGDVKKGEVKQESFVEMVRSIQEKEVNMKPGHRALFDLMSIHSNIPKKKVKFVNFIKSSTAGRANIKDIEEVWNIIEKYKCEQQSLATQNKKSEDKVVKNENNESTKRKSIEEHNESNYAPKKKKKKQKDVQLTQESSEPKGSELETVISEDTAKESSLVRFNFKEKILEVVMKKRSISLNKLQKKVLNAYLKATGESECDPKTIKKFNKKLKKVPNVLISEDTVTLSDNV